MGQLSKQGRLGLRTGVGSKRAGFFFQMGGGLLSNGGGPLNGPRFVLKGRGLSKRQQRFSNSRRWGRWASLGVVWGQALVQGW